MPDDLAVDWPPFAVTEGRLRLGRATLTPAGLAFDDETFAWGALVDHDRPGRGWTLAAEGYGYPPGALVALVVYERSAAATGRQRSVAGVPATLADEGPTTATALGSYLRDTPAARPALDVPLTVSTLLRTLRRKHLGRPRGLPHTPWMGDRYDVHYAVLRGLDDAWPRRYALRPVEGEPVPSLDAVVAAARLRLRPGLRERVTDERLAERARPYLAVEPWPFGALLG